MENGVRLERVRAGCDSRKLARKIWCINCIDFTVIQKKYAFKLSVWEKLASNPSNSTTSVLQTKSRIKSISSAHIQAIGLGKPKNGFCRRQSMCVVQNI